MNKLRLKNLFKSHKGINQDESPRDHYYESMKRNGI